MEIINYEECEGETKLSLEHCNTRVVATREGRRIDLHLRKRVGKNECDYVDVAFDVCFTCEEWQRFLCELGRVHCGPARCEPYDWDDCCEPCEPTRAAVVVEDHDDCDEDNTFVVSVGELREAMRGCKADDLIEISADE